MRNIMFFVVILFLSLFYFGYRDQKKHYEKLVIELEENSNEEKVREVMFHKLFRYLNIIIWLTMVAYAFWFFDVF